jgi:hypothetical protein
MTYQSCHPPHKRKPAPTGRYAGLWERKEAYPGASDSKVLPCGRFWR